VDSRLGSPTGSMDPGSRMMGLFLRAKVPENPTAIPCRRRPWPGREAVADPRMCPRP
jgi:hypothetical protein